MRFTLALTLALTLVGLSAAAAQAGDWPSERNGWMVGFDIGAGSAEAKFEADNDDAVVSSDRFGGAAGGIRVGYALRPDLVLGFDGNGWTRKDEIIAGPFSADVTTTLSAGTIALTWFPNAGDFFLRAGIGGGRVSQEWSNNGGSFTYDANGAALLLDLGYEFRLTRTFALGPQLNFFWANFGEVDVDDGSGGVVTADATGNVVSGSLLMSWYF